MEIATWALFAATTSLVFIGIWYAIETRRIVNRMDRERESLTGPLLTLQLIPWQPQLVKLRIQNLGGGPAINIRGHIRAETQRGSRSTPWSYPVLGPGRYEEFGFPEDDTLPPEERIAGERFNLEAIRTTYLEIKGDFTYESSVGREYKLDDVIDVRAITGEWVESRMLATEDHPDRILPRIAKALEELSQQGRR